MNNLNERTYQAPNLDEICILTDAIVCGSAEGYTYGEGEWSSYDDEF